MIVRICLLVLCLLPFTAGAQAESFFADLRRPGAGEVWQVDFVESRKYGFSRNPRVLRGRMYLLPEGRLYIQYRLPQERLIYQDAERVVVISEGENIELPERARRLLRYLEALRDPAAMTLPEHWKTQLATNPEGSVLTVAPDEEDLEVEALAFEANGRDLAAIRLTTRRVEHVFSFGVPAVLTPEAWQSRQAELIPTIPE